MSYRIVKKISKPLKTRKEAKHLLKELKKGGASTKKYTIIHTKRR